jgi:hypothetical protein
VKGVRVPDVGSTTPVVTTDCSTSALADSAKSTVVVPSALTTTSARRAGR